VIATAPGSTKSIRGGDRQEEVDGCDLVSLRRGGLFKTVEGDGSSSSVGNRIGGRVKQNIDAQIFTNACAIRMSYVLNRSGTLVPAITGKTVSGADHARYLFRVKDLLDFVTLRFGKPDIVVDGNATATLMGKQGLLIFEVSVWRDASGHATLWNGRVCSDHCYFAEANRLRFWGLR